MLKLEVMTGEELQRYFSLRPEVKGMFSPESVLADFQADGVLLRVVEAMQFSGTARFYFDGQKQEVSLPGVVSSMYASDLVLRIRTRESFLFKSHLRIVDPLPAGTYGEITVLPGILNVGCTITGLVPAGYMGPIQFLFHAWRAIEIVRGYPTAYLRVFKEGASKVSVSSEKTPAKKRSK
jgi:hypothetical protein